MANVKTGVWESPWCGGKDRRVQPLFPGLVRYFSALLLGASKLKCSTQCSRMLLGWFLQEVEGGKTSPSWI